MNFDPSSQYSGRQQRRLLRADLRNPSCAGRPASALRKNTKRRLQISKMSAMAQDQMNPRDGLQHRQSLQATKKNKHKEDDDDETKPASPVVSSPVKLTAADAAEPAQQGYDEDDEDDRSNRHRELPSSIGQEQDI